MPPSVGVLSMVFRLPAAMAAGMIAAGRGGTVAHSVLGGLGWRGMRVRTGVAAACRDDDICAFGDHPSISCVGYCRRMRQLFDRAWDSLDVESVRRFLADADDEGLLWEAKGTQVPHRDSVRKAVCGFANALGGYLILGAEMRNNARWELTGLQFPYPEPGSWVGSLIAPAGVSPLPVFDPKPFDLGDGRHAVVVRVEPVDVPPCITASGVAYQRVSGQTLPVTDQRVLMDLLEKGAAARRRTEEAALTAARTILQTLQCSSRKRVCSRWRCALRAPGG
jgi:hypothetical protein